MDRPNVTTGKDQLSGLAEQFLWLFAMQNVKQQASISGNSGGKGHNIALLADDIRRAAFSGFLLRSLNHCWINVNGDDVSCYSPGDLDGECSISTTHFNNIFDASVNAESIKNERDIKE